MPILLSNICGANCATLILWFQNSLAPPKTNRWTKLIINYRSIRKIFWGASLRWAIAVQRCSTSFLWRTFRSLFELAVKGISIAWIAHPLEGLLFAYCSDKMPMPSEVSQQTTTCHNLVVLLQVQCYCVWSRWRVTSVWRASVLVEEQSLNIHTILIAGVDLHLPLQHSNLRSYRINT